MLLAIRERVMGVVGWIILGILFVTFAFFGLNSYLRSTAANYAATVNDQEISLARHQRAYQQLRARMVEMLGENFDPAMLNEDMLKANALQQLINEEVLVQAADREGFAASNQLVAASINAIDAFKENGVFSKTVYERVLGYQGIRPPAFEYNLKQEIIANQYRDAVMRTAAATAEELNQAYLLEGQQRQFSYLVLPLQSFSESLEISDQDIEDYYAAHRDAFMTPERTRIQYLELDASTIVPDIEIDEQAIQALYDEHAAKYVTPEERHARHILVSLLPDADEAATAAALKKAQGIVARLDAGESFEDLAKELSDDPGSAASGGDLGFFGRGMMTPEFEEAVFGLKIGERSQPVKSPFGFHIIELLDIKPEVATPLAEVRDELVDQLLSEERGHVYYERFENLSSLAFEQPDSLQGAADALQLDIKESDWISKQGGGTGIAANTAIVEAAFSEDVLLNGNNSAPIEIGPDHVVVIRTLEHQEAAQQPLDEVKADVAIRVKDEKARKLANARGKEVLASLNAGEATLDTIAAAEKTAVNKTELVLRNASEPDPEIVTAAFSMQAPTVGGTAYEGLATRNGDYVIIALQQVKDGSLSDLPEAARKQAWRSLSRLQGETELAAVMNALKQQAVIQIPPSPDQ
ncbi:MAG: SurA N-terminal domain-containing protein [Gammaproteobacteria bacterium]|nr:SurA N-terminal domain-containing protein [Gammaproteobacteria bacterium]